MTEFHDLHKTPFLLPNAWDHASAAALVAAGFRAIGTTSLGVAAAAGKPDGAGATRAETSAIAASLRHLPAMITVDIEGGYSDDPAIVASFAASLGVAGINLEDGHADGTLTDIGLQREKITAIKERSPDLFVNARTDTHWLGGRPLSEALTRAAAYIEAGADGVFVPGANDEATVSTLVREIDAPLNILYSPTGLPFEHLASLGVRRVSTGSLLFRAALQSIVDLTATIGANGEVRTDVPTYAEIQRWSDA